MRPDPLTAQRADSTVGGCHRPRHELVPSDVARVDAEGRFDVIATEKEMVRLGSGSGDMTSSPPTAMERGIAALVDSRQSPDGFDASVAAVATSAPCARREPRTSSCDRARLEAGVEIEVISGVEEARLIHLGVLQSLPVFDQQVLVVDIGGGSTEFLVGRRTRRPVGALARARRDPPHRSVLPRRHGAGPAPFATAAPTCASLLVPTIRRVASAGRSSPIGSSGTINTLGAMVVARRGGDAGAPTSGVVFTPTSSVR